MVPFKERYFEDYSEGESTEFGDYLVTEAEIIEFAQRYDPQPFHIDEAAAKESIYKGLIGSGWMTASISMRLAVDHFISPIASMGSPGVDEIRWVAPTRPNDRLRVRMSVIATRRSQSKPDRGTVQFYQETINQNNEVVMRQRTWGMIKCRT